VKQRSTLFVVAVMVSCLSSVCMAADARTGPALPQKLKQAGPNAWVMLDVGGYGSRNSTALVYLPGERKALLLGGAYGMKGPYSELVFNLAEGRWENRFPKGKFGLWGERTGPSKAPAFNRYKPFKDTEGNVRPNLAYGYNHRMELWGNCAYDRSRGKLVVPFHVLKQTCEYDVKDGTWQLVESAADAPSEFWDAIVFGAMCYDPIHKEVLAGHCRWVFRDGTWKKREFGSALIQELRGKAVALRRRGRALVGACRARFYHTESDEMAATKLGQTVAELARDVAAFSEELEASSDKATTYEKKQLLWAHESLGKAAQRLDEAQAPLEGQVTPKIIATVEDAWEALDDAVEDLAPAPSKRAYSAVACDRRRGKMVLFGGHRLDRVVADTWVYDCETRMWENRRPERSPSPRYGHGLAWLPDSGQVVLVDGVQKRNPFAETWVYDTEANLWTLLVEGGTTRPGLTSYASTWGWQPEPAVALPGDVVLMLCNRAHSKPPRYSTWAARIDPNRTDAAMTAKKAVADRTEVLVDGRDAPRWYDQNAGDIDPAAQQAWLDQLPANTWVAQPPSPNGPRQNRAWGTAMFDPDRDQILHWGGGHVAYTGNAVVHYSVKTNRYYIGQRPEHGLRYVHGQGGMPVSQTYRGRPFMTGHAYHSYAYDPPSKTLVVCGQNPRVMVKGRFFFAYDPARTVWLRGPIEAPFPISYSGTILCATPKGAVAWSSQELWRVDVANRTWKKLPVTGTLPRGGPDRHGMTYDSKRDRLLLFARALKGDIVACDFKTGKAAALAPKGKEPTPGVPSREVVYMPDRDAVLLAARVRDEKDQMRWLVYDCRANAWKALLLDGRDPIGNRDATAKRGGAVFNVSLGLMYDRKRKLVWAMNSRSHVTVLRLDLTTVDAAAPKAPPTGT
jgi:hypothetical protein